VIRPATVRSALARSRVAVDRHYSGDRVATGDLTAQVSSEDPLMNLDEAADLGSFILRFAVGAVFITHGYNQILAAV
jgi:hypothetical protein